MDNIEPLAPAAADPAEAEENKKAAPAAGKFRDADALLAAYTSLEAEFTRRSQRLKELERAVKEEGAAQASTPEPSPQGGQDGARLLEAAMQSDEVKARIIAEYLQNAAKNKSVPLIAGGVNVPARRAAPVTVRQAGELAQRFLDKRR